MFCTVCSTYNPHTDRSCPACGAKPGPAPKSRSERSERSATPTAPAAQRPGSGTPLLLRVALVGLPLALALGLFLLIGWQEWEQRAQQRRDYQSAELALVNGDLDTAEAVFAALGSYRDAAQRRAAVHAQAEPFRNAIADAELAYADGDFREAIDVLKPVVTAEATFEPASRLFAASQQALAKSLLADADAAEIDRDWLAVEQHLTEAAQLQPADPGVTARLELMLEQHAPITFARDGIVYLVGPNGEDERALTDDIGALWPSWSPDRSRIAFLVGTSEDSPFDGTLMVMKADGSDVQTLVSRVLPFTWPAWSPDGRTLAYASIAEFNEATFEGRVSLRTFDLDTGQERDLTGDRLRHVSAPSWSPDGKQIAFVSFRMENRRGGGVEFLDGDAWIVDIGSSELRNVTNGRVVDEGWIIWSPTGERLMVFTTPGDWTDPRKSEIFLLDATNDALTRLPVDEWELSLPSWSPDGTRLAFVVGGNMIRIWSDAGEEWVTVQDEIAPYLTWSPNGKLLLAPAANPNASSYLLEMADDFGAQTPVSIVYDDMRGSSGPPVWGPRTTQPPAPSPDPTETST